MAGKKLNAKQQASLEWWEKKLSQGQAKSFEASEYKKMNRRNIGIGSMVTFSYPNPKTPLSALKFFDAQPLVFIFNIRANYIHAINLHWAHKKFREIIVSFVIKINKQNIKQDRRMQLSWAMLVEFLKRNGLAHIVTKTYITPRIQKMTYIPPQEWKYAIELPSEKFVLDGKYSQSDLDKYIRSHIPVTKSSKNKRFGR